MQTSATILLTEQQQEAFDKILDWTENEGSTFYTLSGYSGTGKTMLLGRLYEEFMERGLSVAASSTTHKAAAVLRSKGMNNARTVHSLLGVKMQRNYETGEEKLVPDSQTMRIIEDFDIVIVDECSMINQELMDVIKKVHHYQRNPIFLFVGDPAQLPPVNERESESFRYNGITLTDVVRQQKDSGILRLATAIRADIETETWPEILEEDDILLYDNPKDYVKKAVEMAIEDKTNTKMLAWTNASVAAANAMARRLLYGQDAPEWVIGENVIFADRYEDKNEGSNWHNSEECQVVSVEEAEANVVAKGSAKRFKVWRLGLEACGDEMHAGYVEVLQRSEMDRFDGLLKGLKDSAKHTYDSKDRKKRWIEYFNTRDRFANLVYGYAMTVHKSQGSTFKNVFLHASNLAMNNRIRERNQLLYVGVSRASETLHVLE